MSETTVPSPPSSSGAPVVRTRSLRLVFYASPLAFGAVAWVLVEMFGHKQDAHAAFTRLVAVDETTTDPTP